MCMMLRGDKRSIDGRCYCVVLYVALIYLYSIGPIIACEFSRV